MKANFVNRHSGHYISRNKLLINSMKLIAILIYLLFSFQFIKHDYRSNGEINSHKQNSVDKYLLNLTSIDKLGTPTNYEKISNLNHSHISVECTTLTTVPIYGDFSLCFQNYSLFMFLRQINLEYLIAQLIIIPILIFLITMYIIRSEISFSLYLNLIIIGFLPNLIGIVLDRGLNGIQNENDSFLLNLFKLSYFNLIHNSTEISPIGLELRQVGSWLTFIILYLLAFSNAARSILLLLCLTSITHIYLYFVMIVFIIIMKSLSLLKISKLVSILILIHLFAIILYQRPEFYTDQALLLINVFLVLIIIVVSKRKIVLDFTLRLTKMQNLMIIVLTFFLFQLIFLILRSTYFYNLPNLETLRDFIVFEKGGSVIERLSMFLRPVIYLLILMTLKACALKIQNYVKKSRFSHRIPL